MANDNRNQGAEKSPSTPTRKPEERGGQGQAHGQGKDSKTKPQDKSRESGRK